MINALKVLFGYKRILVMDGNGDTRVEFRKYYRIVWKNIFYNMYQKMRAFFGYPRKTLLNTYERNNYRKEIEAGDFGHVNLSLIDKITEPIDENKFHYGEKIGYIIPPEEK